MKDIPLNCGKATVRRLKSEIYVRLRNLRISSYEDTCRALRIP
jgi:hypothetical protein